MDSSPLAGILGFVLHTAEAAELWAVGRFAMAYPRTILGLVLAPLSTAMAVALVFVVGWVLQLGWFRDRPFSVVTANIGTYLVFAVPVAYALTILLGVPTYMFATRSRRPGLIETSVLGALLGSVPSLFTIPVANWQSLWWLSLTSTSGLLTAFTFWTIAVGHRNNAPNSARNR